MSRADEIRKWMTATDKPGEKPGDPGKLLFPLPFQPSSIPGMTYLRCAGEQRVIVETEIAAQLAELNETLRLIYGRMPIPPACPWVETYPPYRACTLPKDHGGPHSYDKERMR